MRIESAVALVSGGASGLGLATVRRLLDGGARVHVLDLPSAREGFATLGLGPRAAFHAVDVTNQAEVRAAVAAAAEDGAVRVAVGCAGVATPAKLVADGAPLDFDAFMRVVAVNLGGVVNLAAAAAAVMRSNDAVDGERGVIVNTASVAAYEGQIGQIAYAASKAGVVGYTLPAARELARDLIRVVTVAPGLFETPMMAGFDDRVREALASKALHPGRLGMPEEFAALVEHVIENPYLNGETIRLDGAVRLEPR